MSLPVTCSACQYHFAVPPEFAGKRGKCPKCGAIIIAPAATGAPPAPKTAPPVRLKTAAPLEPVASAPPPPRAAAARPAPVPAPAPLPPSPRTSEPVPSGGAFNFDVASTSPAPSSGSSVAARRGSKKSSNTGLLIALGAGGGVLTLALIVGLVVALSGGSGDKVAANALDKDGKVVNKNKKSKPGMPVAEDTGGLLERPRPQGPIDIVAAKPRAAISIEDVRDGVVRIETPGIGGMSLGTGFVINEKGWIATNCHVIDDATDQTRVILRNSEYKVAGLVIKAPEHDMAIIKLAELPFQLTVLDISYSQHPKLASNVRAIGFPSGTFNITDGIVSNVTTADGLTNEGQRAFLRSVNAAPHHLWIQHSAKISPGNSGGPILNEHNQVIGINTWVSSDIDVGYAGHINHLRDLIAMAKNSETVTPFPKGVGVEIASGDELYNTVFTAARVQQLITFCSKFQWKPSTVEEFDGMAELAKLITIAKMAPPGRLQGDVKLATDQAVQLMSRLTWDADQIAKVNQFASEATNKPLHGIVFVATMVEPDAQLGENAKADRLKFEGSDRLVIVKASTNRSIGAKDARMLVIGLNMPALITFDEGADAQRLIVPGFSKELK